MCGSIVVTLPAGTYTTNLIYYAQAGVTAQMSNYKKYGYTIVEIR
jgi:hypothetical protein